MSIPMKKLISSLMIGLIATTATMSVMAAPSYDPHHPSAPHHFNKKPMPPKHGMHHGPQHNVHFDKKDHKGFFNKDKHYHNAPHYKLPPKHR